MHSALRPLPLLISAALVALPSDSRASDPLPVWGEFSREELFALHFPDAPDADAVVLSDHGEIRVDEKLTLRARRHQRTKIFTASAVERLQTVRIPYGRDDKILGFRAQTVVPPQRFVKAERKDETTPDGNRVCVISFAEVAPGTILEFSYERWSPSIAQLEPWVFQSDDPTRVSRIDLQLPPGMAYVSAFNWTPGAAPHAESSVVLDPEHVERELQQSTWVERDVPAFRPEPLLSSAADYRLTLYLQLTVYANGGTTAIAPTWPEAAARIHDTWSQARANPEGVASWLAGTTGASPSETARGVYRRIRDDIAETGTGNPAAPAPLRDTVSAARGSRVDKNLLLLHALESAGIPARGILLRPRSEGRFVNSWRNPDQLSAMIVEATLDGASVRLDATRGCPFGVLSAELTVREGVAVGTDGGVRDLEPLEAGAEIVAGTRARLEPNGDLVARTRWTHSGPEAAAAGRAAASQSLDSHIRARLAPALRSAMVTGTSTTANEDGTVTLDAALRVNGWAEIRDDGLSFRVPCLFGADANPVPPEGRTYPLEFTASTRDESLELRLPAGFQLTGESAGTRAAAAGLTFVSVPDAGQDVLKVRRRQVIPAIRVPEESHPEVRDFYRALLEEEGRLWKARPVPSLAAGETR